ncbi:MAG: formate dehydrogenase accessory sulfurtransferase FdhD [Clostridia bacterium]|nr:formate dehydrogenase accessory sulfurtransferase FdhD [Clostridia bacterium]
MNIVDLSRSSHLERAVRVSAEDAASFCLASEHSLRIYVNEALAMQVVCTPDHLDELAAGRLLTEGLIRAPDDIRELYICAQGLNCKVWLHEAAPVASSPDLAISVGTCCTDSRTLVEQKYRDLPRVRPVPWEADWLRATAGQLKDGAPLYALTHAAHACYLGRAGEILCVREDIGRHNALDKAIGYGLLNGVSLTECYLLTTGRMPADMVAKAIRAGIPLLASKTFPTAEGLAMAREAGLTLVTLRGAEQMIVWNREGAESSGRPD